MNQPAPAPADTAAPASNPAPATASPAPTPSPAPASSDPSPAPGANPNPAPAGGDPASPTPASNPDPNAYKIPDAYKDKPWAGKIKSEADLWTQLDNTQALIGKKHLTPDWDKATPEEIAAYNKSVAPAEASAYDFGTAVNTPDDTKAAIGGILQKNGVSAHNGKGIIADYQAYEAQKLEAATSAEGFKTSMSTMFGTDYAGVVKAVTDAHKTIYTPEEQKIIDGLPNDVLALMYKGANGFIKQYGGGESGAPGEAVAAPVAGTDVDKTRSDLRAQIKALDARPHTAEERQGLVDKLQGTYSTPAQRR